MSNVDYYRNDVKKNLDIVQADIVGFLIKSFEAQNKAYEILCNATISETDRKRAAAHMFESKMLTKIVLLWNNEDDYKDAYDSYMTHYYGLNWHVDWNAEAQEGAQEV